MQVIIQDTLFHPPAACNVDRPDLVKRQSGEHREWVIPDIDTIGVDVMKIKQQRSF